MKGRPIIARRVGVVLGIPLCVSEAIPPDEVWVTEGGKVTHKIVNVRAAPREGNPG